MKNSILMPAKINLFLDVLSKRTDGYHEIKTIMQTISIYDEISLEITPSNSLEISLSGTSDKIQWNESNLVHKACMAFIKKYGCTNRKFSFHIDKKIPISAGMAGGSTDAAGALLLLNKAFDNPFSTEQLCDIGSKLGADIPFCILGGTCLCEGIGEKITKISPFSEKLLVCAIGKNSAVSTPEAYALIDNIQSNNILEPICADALIDELKDGSDLAKIAGLLYNKFENVIVPKTPNIQDIKDILISNGALGALMSGSGPSVFGIFDSESAQKSAFNALKEAGFSAFLCKSV